MHDDSFKNFHLGVGSRVIGRCAADLFREDLAIEGMALGLVGFALDLPAGTISPREGYTVSVRREGRGTYLPGSPRVPGPAMRLVR